jgi:dTDP-glucose 4,6-dehydratase
VSVLVSGGAGLIGSHLVERLLADGATVTVLDNFSTGRRANLEAIPDRVGLTVLETDLTRPLPLDRLGGPFSQIYHLASPASPVDFVRFPLVTLLVNSLGTRALLELAQRDRARFVLASTSEVYGDPLVHPQAETYWGNVNPIGPRSPYDESKRFAESLTMTIWRTAGDSARRPDRSRRSHRSCA